jgi:hypothetical protein
MCKIPNSTRSNSASNFQNQGGSVREPLERYTIVKEANRKIRLIDILKSYNIVIIRNSQQSDWSNNIVCPFPFHKERAPSFGYCFKDDHFTCLGCGKSGRAVEFISLKEGVSRTVVAKNILDKYYSSDPSSIQDDSENYEDHLTPILMEYSSFLNKFIQNNKNNPKIINQVEKLLWWIDHYLISKASTKSISEDGLKYRLERLKSLL